ncbi:serine hydrolase FSH [Phyllosticta citrichinensis]|uniref:Serine hydrolase FSH n=1 Tax=Phyllosticta citrichinensis TaxID=1130410 RepID=A0ABR1XEU5_9PEZI
MVKYLCLPGAYGSAKNFQVQLGPFAAQCSSDGTLSYHWTQGSYSAVPPPGYEDYFGPRPLYRFIEYDGVEAFEDILEIIRNFPEGLNSEDTMRRLTGGDVAPTAFKSLRRTMDGVFKILDEDPEIEGILGYSEGATVAATMIFEEKRLWERYGRPRKLKSAIFFAGWPPVAIDQKDVRCVLADECDDVLDVPTLHIVGCDDPYIHGAMALFNVCDEDTAELFDHGKGHTVPRDARTLRELGDAVQRMVSKTTALVEGFENAPPTARL